MNGPGYVMGGSGATPSQLKETDEGQRANQLKEKKTLILTSGNKMFFFCNMAAGTEVSQSFRCFGPG